MAIVLKYNSVNKCLYFLTGIAALPGNRWEQRQDCTKVAFSRFYC